MFLKDKPDLLKEWHPSLNEALAPSKLSLGSNRKVWWVCPEGHEYQQTVVARSSRGTGCPYCSGNRVLAGFNDLASSRPDLLAHWHPTKNGQLTPSEVSKGSGKKCWWICEKGHEYELRVVNRIKEGSDCPYCSGQRVLAGLNDLASQFPDLVSEWSPENVISADEIHHGSNTKRFWVCDLGHSCDASVASRTRAGTGCAICSNRKLLPGFNDLATTHPLLAKQWHKSRNEELLAREVSAGSGKKAWWQCEKGHEWEAQITSRAHGGVGCPYCANKAVWIGFNDLATTNPEIAAEWSTKNLPTTPQSVVSGSGKKYWWVCPLGHDYLASVHDRTIAKGCSICAGKKVLAGFNDFQHTFPEAAKFWDYKGNRVGPDEVVRRSHKSFWFVCAEGHSSRQSLVSVRRAGQCAVCAGQRVVIGYNDLASQEPEISNEWDWDKNHPLSPNEITPGSGRDTWWKCSFGHSWRAAPYTRRKGIGCPICINRLVQQGVNDLATTHPELAMEWHPRKNQPIQKNEVNAGSPELFWWQCEKGHEWRASANNRKRGTDCPACANHGFDSTKPAVVYFMRHEGFSARKVGITGQATNRLERFRRYGWSVEKTWKTKDGYIAREVESKFFDLLVSHFGLTAYLEPRDTKGTEGWTETFADTGPKDSELIGVIEDLLEELG